VALSLSAGPSSYKSEAIRVIKSLDLNQEATTPVLDVVAPSDQKLQAEVRSTAQMDHVKVQLWAMAFGTGSTPYLNSFGGTAGEEIPAGLGDPMGPNTSRTFSRDWEKSHGLSATDPEIIPLLGTNDEFHCCIKANVFAVDDQENVIEGVKLGPSPTIDFDDVRQAQRNMTIKTHATGTAMMMLMFAGNTDDEREQPIRLLVKDRPLKRLPRLELVELEAIAPWIRPSRKRFGAGFVPGLEVAFGDERFPIRFAERPLDDLQLELAGASGPELEVVLPPRKPHRMIVQAELPKEDFVLRSIDVAQIENKEVVGEAHVLLLSAPQELVETPEKRDYARA
jgi:hypothetical protein